MEKKKPHYHIWFVTKYRKVILEGKIEKMVKDIFVDCISRHGYNILAFETNRDHMHILAEAENKEEIASMVRTLKAVSAGQILQAEACRGKRAFWARRYGCKKILPENVAMVTSYIVDQKKIPHASAWGMHAGIKQEVKTL